jgi:hypothetical protein
MGLRVTAEGGRRAGAAGARLLLLASLPLVVLAGSPALASGGPDHLAHQATVPGWLGLALLAAGALGLSACGRSGRRAALAALALLVAVFGVATAVHSVHHLSDPQAAASCALFGAFHHAPGAGAALPDADAPDRTAEPTRAIDREQPRPLQALRLHEGRAPPASPSV